MKRCPVGSFRQGDKCVPIRRCPNGTHRTCQPVHLIRENMDRLKARVGDNELLEHVIKDYEDLYQKVEKKNAEQQEQMNRILQYLRNIHEKHFLSDTGLKHIEHEREKLLERLRMVSQTIHDKLK